MKKIINGKKYDTTTARELKGWANHVPASDFSYYEETLYQKRNGEFFLHGRGNAASRYATSCGTDGWASGEEIVPLTWEAARKWAEAHLGADAYEAIFGEVPEDESRITTTISLSTGAMERAKRAAAKAGISVSAYLESLIQEA